MLPRIFDSGQPLTPHGETWDANYQPDPDDFPGHEPNLVGTLFVGAILAFMGLLILSVSAGVGVGFLLFGIFLMIGSYIADKSDVEWGSYGADDEAWSRIEDDLDQAQTYPVAYEDLTKRQIDEIVKAVKATIRVRCRYCGTLNEEKANKCESCGANL